MQHLLQNVDAALDGIEDPSKRLAAFVEFHVTYHIDRKQEVFISYSELRSLDPNNFNAIVTMRRDYEQKLVDIIESGAETGAFAISDAQAVACGILAMLSGIGTWFNPKGRLIWINRSVERITGYTPLECLLSSNLVDMLVFGKDRKSALEVALKALRGSTGDNFEVRLKHKDGSVIWTVINWQPINSPSGEYLGLRVSCDEIQNRKEAELKLLDTVVELRRAQALKEYYLTHSNEERSRLEALLNVMNVGVLSGDGQPRIT